ncbi:MAG: acyl-CoA dehydrogenase family protein [Actinomycetes bacterium]
MPVERLLPSDEAYDLLDLVREIGAEKLEPRAAADEASSTFPRDLFELLGQSGLLSLPYPVELGGGGQPYETYLQVLEELASSWMAVALGISVHGLSCYPVAAFGTPQQQEELLPRMLSGETLGAYCLSETNAGSDVASMTTRARPTDGGYRLDGTKAWITHAGVADFYSVFARTSDDRTAGISAFLVESGTDGLSFGAHEKKMGLTSSPTAQMHFEGVEVPADRLIGAEGIGLRIALAALDTGRLGIAACATGLAQAALDVAARYALERQQFGRAIAEFQGLQFLLADMEAAISSARASYLLAARLKDAGRPFSRQASVAKLVATDAAMKVTTDAVQVLGGYGYTKDFPVERYMREAKVTQIFEGTNQIQRLVISRALLKAAGSR